MLAGPSSAALTQTGPREVVPSAQVTKTTLAAIGPSAVARGACSNASIVSGPDAVLIISFGALITSQRPALLSSPVPAGSVRVTAPVASNVSSRPAGSTESTGTSQVPTRSA